MGKDYLEFQIDTMRMTHGDAVAERLKKQRGGGRPWLVILDADGEEMVVGIGPKGNIGCPISQAEADWFFEMIDRTKQRLSDEDLATLRAEHDAFAEPIRARRR